MTECNQSSFGLEGSGKREIVARFDGGTISSDGGALLLRQTDKRLNLCRAWQSAFWMAGIRSKWSIPFWRCSRKGSMAWPWDMKTSTITSNCGVIQSLGFWRDGMN